MFADQKERLHPAAQTMNAWPAEIAGTRVSGSPETARHDPTAYGLVILHRIPKRPTTGILDMVLRGTKTLLSPIH